jgi:hypothetical protein
MRRIKHLKSPKFAGGFAVNWSDFGRKRDSLQTQTVTIRPDFAGADPPNEALFAGRCRTLWEVVSAAQTPP